MQRRAVLRSLSGVESGPPKEPRPTTKVAKSALLCPGPSIRKDWHPDLFDDYGFVVAINTTAWKYRCHYLFCSDKHIIKPLTEGVCDLPLITTFTNKGVSRRLRNCRIPCQPLDRIRDDKQAVCAYTMPNALSFCLDRADYVEVFGMDYSNQKLDFAGQKGCHEAVRWLKEAAWLRQVWQNDRIIVNGEITRERLDYLAGKREDWPL